MTLQQATIVEQEDCLRVSGNLNFFTVMDVWYSSLPLLKNKASLRFDLSQVTSANSAGLALLFAWKKHAKHYAQSISFDHIPNQLSSIAKVAGIENLF